MLISKFEKQPAGNPNQKEASEAVSWTHSRSQTTSGVRVAIHQVSIDAPKLILTEYSHQLQVADYKSGYSRMKLVLNSTW